ncbi:amino acid adenylation domain-containing protein [bacterium]|nr:amino acid adenylation domain-containing protein [bacterium]
MSGAAKLLNELRSKRIAFHYGDGKLRYSGPRGVINEKYRSRLKECRNELIEIIIREQSQVEDSIPRLGRYDDALELSNAQQQLWFLEQLAGPSHVYNLPVALKFSGKLNIDALKHAAQAIVRRHDALSTSFMERDSRPLMMIHENVDVPFRVEDISFLPADKRKNGLELKIRNEASALFDLARAPLLRCMVVVLGNDEYVLIVTCHHIISDGWSMGTIINDLAQLYNAKLQEIPASLPRLSIKFADFAAWQRKELSADRIDAEMAFWKEKLLGMPDMSTLPADKQRPPIQSFDGDVVSFKVSPALTSRLRHRAGKMKTTLNVLLATAFGLLLSRYSGQDDIIIGIALANRTRKEFEPLVGMFANFLPLRCDFTGRNTFAECVARTSKAVTELLQHSSIPLEILVDKLNVSRDLSHQAVFQTYFTLLPPLGTPPEFSGMDQEWLQIRSDISKFDISLYSEETDDGLICFMEYATALFDRESVKRWKRSLLTLLETVVNNPETLADESVLIAGKDRALLSEWGKGREEQISDRPLIELLRTHAVRNPDSMAIIGENLSMTYADLDRASDRIMSVLQAGKKEDFIGVCMEKSPETIAAMLAVLKKGSAFIPLDSSQPKERLRYMIENSRLKTILVDSKTMDIVKCFSGEWLNVINITALPEAGTVERKRMPDDCSSASPAYVIYTSGSTGRPKGVAVPHKGLLNIIKWYADTFAITEKDIISQSASFSFDASIAEVWVTLCSGACLHLVPADIIFDPWELRDWIISNNITIHFSPTPIAEILFQSEWYEDCDLRILYTGGDALKVRPSANLPFKTCNMYGPTENSVASVSTWLLPVGNMPPEIGRPLYNINCHLLRQHGEMLVPVPPGALGELYISGRGLAIEYINDPERTRSSFLYWSPETFFCGKKRPDAIRVYKTGDLVRYRHDGNLEFAGRVDNQVKIRGFRIEPGEIENVLRNHAGTEDAIVITHGSATEDKRLIAFVKNSAESTVSKGELLAHLKKLLPAYMIPADIILLKEFPLLPSGKIDRKGLEKLFRARTVRKQSALLSEDKLMKTIAAVWEDVLEITSPGVEDNFFDLGGCSLLLIKVRNLLSKQGYHPELMDLFRYPTIASLSTFLKSGEREKSTSENRYSITKKLSLSRIDESCAHQSV